MFQKGVPDNTAKGQIGRISSSDLENKQNGRRKHRSGGPRILVRRGIGGRNEAPHRPFEPCRLH